MSADVHSIASNAAWTSAVMWLRCPRTGATLVVDGNRLVSTDESTRLAYPVVDDIPVLLPDRGCELPREEWSKAMETTALSG